MTRITSLMLSAAAPLLLGLSLATAAQAETPMAAHPMAAQMSDQAYCNELTREFSMGGARGGFAPQSLSTDVAIAQCREGQPRQAIPVLQRQLKSDGFTVPSRM
ncbi:MAG: hypothetical protein ACOY4R_30830 [Pseudomonadota bacterium]